MAGSDNALWNIWQIDPGGKWSTWGFLGTPPGSNSISDPAAGENADGRLEAFVVGSDNGLWHRWQTEAWRDLG